MTMKFSKEAILSLAASALLMAGTISSVHAYEQGKEYKYIVLHINDTHGHFWQDNLGQGGFPAIATIVKQVKAANQGVPVLVLHAGDVMTGVPESDLQKGVPDIIGLNAIGFDAWAVGNHEFDLTLDEMKATKKLSKTPMIAANIKYTDPATKQTAPFYDPYVFFERDGLKFLVVGNTTPSTKYQSSPEHTAPFTFEDPAISFQEAVKASEVKNGKADVIISLSHLGYYANGQHGDMPYGDTTLATKLPKDEVALFVTGHTHVPGCVNEKNEQVWPQPGERCVVPYSNGAPIVQAYKWGLNVGKAELTFKDGVSTLVKYDLIPVNLKKEVYDYTGKKAYIDAYATIAQDEELTKLLKPYQDIGNQKLLVKVGNLSQELIPSRTKETKLAYIIAEAKRVKTQADVAVVNSGNVRDRLPQGDTSYRDVLIVLPFSNTLTTVNMSGRELQDYINKVAFLKNGAYPNYAGVTFDADAQAKTISNIKVGGKPLNLSKTYKLVVFNFLAQGGDTYPAINKLPSFVDTGYNDADTLVDYLKNAGTLDVSKIVVEGPNWKNK